MVTTKQKSIVNAQRMKRKKYKHTTKDSHQTIREQEDREDHRVITKQPENN